jgi:hypothetical protein
MRRCHVCDPLSARDLGVFADLAEPGFSVDLGDHDTNQLQWSKVNIPAGTQVTISVMDGNDDEGWSGSVSCGNVSLPICSLIFFLSRLPLRRAMTTPA